MWLLSDFPSERLGRFRGFSPSKEWLEHTRLSAVRLALGCSGSFVSKHGLVMTNHHCAADCIAQLSTKANDLTAAGFTAKTQADERRCPGMEVNQLVEITDVTEQVAAATKGLSDRAYLDAQKGVVAKLEKACAKDDGARCDVVSLYRGGLYHLYRYARFQDVRLVFAPESGIAFFGGDPDNFNFPRYNLDLTFLRVYGKDQKPLEQPHYFPWSKVGPKEGELTFVAGHPGRTSRLLTLSQLAWKRDVELPNRLQWLSEKRGLLNQYASIGKEERRTSQETLHTIENGLKALRGRREALVEPAFLEKKRAAEASLRNAVESATRPELAQAKGAWDAIARAEEEAKRLFVRYAALEGSAAIDADLFGYARTLVRAAAEFEKKNEERLPEYADAKKPAIKAQLFADAPTYAGLESLLLTHGLVKLRELISPDDPAVRAVLGKKSPRDVASAAVRGTKLGSPSFRKSLFGDLAAVAKSQDPMLVLARTLDGPARAVRKEWEDKVDAIIKKNDELIARARFAAEGTSLYPDATFSLRLSFGVARGYRDGARDVPMATTFGGLFDRATGAEPFELPPRWISAEKAVDRNVPFNFVTTNDIIGGNSGSPVIDKQGEIVGLIFDGNIHSLGGDFGYEGEKNRAVAVNGRGIVHALKVVYGATRVLEELEGNTR